MCFELNLFVERVKGESGCEKGRNGRLLCTHSTDHTHCPIGLNFSFDTVSLLILILVSFQIKLKGFK